MLKSKETKSEMVTEGTVLDWHESASAIAFAPIHKTDKGQLFVSLLCVNKGVSESVVTLENAAYELPESTLNLLAPKTLYNVLLERFE